MVAVFSPRVTSTPVTFRPDGWLALTAASAIEKCSLWERILSTADDLYVKPNTLDSTSAYWAILTTSLADCCFKLSSWAERLNRKAKMPPKIKSVRKKNPKLANRNFRRRTSWPLAASISLGMSSISLLSTILEFLQCQPRRHRKRGSNLLQLVAREVPRNRDIFPRVAPRYFHPQGVRQVH